MFRDETELQRLRSAANTAYIEKFQHRLDVNISEFGSILII